MAQNVVNIRTTYAQLREALLRLPAEARNNTAVAQALMTRVGLTALGRIKQAFVVKARGGTDEAGDRWPPLSPKTIAYSVTRSRGRGGRTKVEKGRPSSQSQALTAKQQARWWDLYRQGLAMFKGDKASAARRAWAIANVRVPLPSFKSMAGGRLKSYAIRDYYSIAYRPALLARSKYSVSGRDGL